MIKKLILTLLFLGIAINCHADKYYIFIEKGGVEKGDVITYLPYTPQYKPTKAELHSYKIIVMDLTDEEIAILTESDWKGRDVIRERKLKIDIENLQNIKQEEVINDKKKIFDNIIIKPSPVVIRPR